MNDSPTNLPDISVSELSGAIKRTVEDAFGFVRVRGEISGFRGASPSGHVYFRLKDANAVIEAVIWKGVYGRLRIRPQEGLEVIATGKVTTFPGSSKYQIVIEALEPAGVGALMALLEERRQKLLAEGLFDAAGKKPLPFLPGVIGVVTSPTGAVIRDISCIVWLTGSRGRCWSGRYGCRARAAPRRWPAPSMASTPLTMTAICRARISLLLPVAAARWKTSGASTRRWWCGRRRQAAFR